MSSERRLKPGEVLINEGDYGDEAYLIRSGEIAISTHYQEQTLHLATIGSGEIVGEMALVDEKPRSATATATSDCVVEVIHRKRFLQLLREDSDMAIEMLKVLFERLRNAQQRMRYSNLNPPPEANTTPAPAARSQAHPPTLLMTGLTDAAINLLPEGGVKIDRYPFRIGRRSSDPLIDNELNLKDMVPYQISRSHAAIILENGRPAVIDRGSHLGLEINGLALGGRDGEQGYGFLQADDNELCLGGDDSDYWFRIEFV